MYASVSNKLFFTNSQDKEKKIYTISKCSIGITYSAGYMEMNK